VGEHEHHRERTKQFDNSGLRNERCQAGSNISIQQCRRSPGVPVGVGGFAKGANNRELAGAGFNGVVRAFLGMCGNER
jgi:hypothetical protein